MTGPFVRQHQLRFGAPLPAGGTTLSWRGPAIMGVLNLTPDSFSDGGDLLASGAAVRAGLELRERGALVVDVGGESTRPGAAPVAEAAELKRILPTIESLAAAGVLVSVDTRKPAVARAALQAGARIVNDIGGLQDPAMREVCAAAGAPAVVMHMRGEPRTMQHEPRYEDVVAEVGDFLASAAAEALSAGVPDVLIDPGIGFGKTVEHNLALLRATAALAARGHGLLVGASRKGFLGSLTGTGVARERLGATLAAHLVAARGGAAMLRVHDVEAHRQALVVAAALEAESGRLRPSEPSADEPPPVVSRNDKGGG
ncbi:MAG TPA: dihydropteroate synthase [Trueperaceae bacterium]|nr:dihydropteroate synthase [Trueperaceae bacterium]